MLSVRRSLAISLSPAARALQDFVRRDNPELAEDDADWEILAHQILMHGERGVFITKREESAYRFIMERILQ